MRAAIEAAEAEPPATPSSSFEHAYAEPPPALARDLAELRGSARERRRSSCVEAVNDALHVELARDDSVMVIGEDVGRSAGSSGRRPGCATGSARPVRRHAALRSGILGAAVGLCMAGWRPVVEMQYDAFSYPCLDQLITHVGRYRWRTGGRWASRSSCACRTGAASGRPNCTTTRPRRTTSTRPA